MKKRMAWPVVLAFIFCGTCCFAQADLANKYRAGMIPTFVKYAKIGSMSDDNAEWMTPGQEKMAQVLYEDVKALGFPTHFSADKYIYVNIPSNQGPSIPTIGISTHYDTTPDINGNNIHPKVIQHYDGSVIDLTPQETNPAKKKVIDPAQDTYLQRMIGKTIVVEEGGNTNLGADDKAGVTIVMTLLKTLAENPQIPHGPIDIVLTPNEDVGRSAERLELEYYNPDYAFDFDAGVNGEVIIANFSADRIVVTAPDTDKKMFRILLTVQGVNAHQSYASTNGYRNGPRPYSDLVNFADSLAHTFPGCFTNMTDLFAQPKTVYTENAHQLQDLLLCCDSLQEAQNYFGALRAEIQRVSQEAGVTVDLKVSEVQVQDPQVTRALTQLVSFAAATEHLPNNSSGEQGYNEPHHMGRNYVDFRLRYFDEEEGKRYQQRITHVADSLSKSLSLQKPLQVQVFRQYANVENGVKPESLLLIANAMSKAGFRLPQGKTRERLEKISKDTGIKLLKGHGRMQGDFKKERAGTTSAMIMAKHGFGGYTVFTGQNNPHAFTEWLSEEDMFKGYQVSLNLIEQVLQLPGKN